jgi:hypothetical protein
MASVPENGQGVCAGVARQRPGVAAEFGAGKQWYWCGRSDQRGCLLGVGALTGLTCHVGEAANDVASNDRNQTEKAAAAGKRMASARLKPSPDKPAAHGA